MKKTNLQKKLQFRRDTVRVLTAPQLHVVIGGALNDAAPRMQVGLGARNDGGPPAPPPTSFAETDNGNHCGTC